MITQRFIVAGQPFSKLTWIALFLTTDRSLCHCEPRLFIAHASELKEKLSGSFYTHLGAAGVNLSFFLKQIQEDLQPRILIVEREPQDIDKLVLAKGMPLTNYQYLLDQALSALPCAENVLRVPFEALGAKRTLQRLFMHCLPGIAFDEVRCELFRAMWIDHDAVDLAQNAQRYNDAYNKLCAQILPLIQARPLPVAQTSMVKH